MVDTVFRVNSAQALEQMGVFESLKKMSNLESQETAETEILNKTQSAGGTQWLKQHLDQNGRVMFWVGTVFLTDWRLWLWGRVGNAQANI